MLRIRHLYRFRGGQVINLDPVLEVVQPSRGEIDPAGYRPGPQPLNKIGPGAKSHFQHLLAMISGELCERMDERLITIAIGLDLLEIFSGELRGACEIRVATLPVPEIRSEEHTSELQSRFGISYAA